MDARIYSLAVKTSRLVICIFWGEFGGSHQRINRETVNQNKNYEQNGTFSFTSNTSQASYLSHAGGSLHEASSVLLTTVQHSSEKGLKQNTTATKDSLTVNFYVKTSYLFL